MELRQFWAQASQPQQLVIFVCNAFRQPGGGNRGKPDQNAADLRSGDRGVSFNIAHRPVRHRMVQQKVCSADIGQRIATASVEPVDDHKPLPRSVNIPGVKIAMTHPVAIRKGIEFQQEPLSGRRIQPLGSPDPGRKPGHQRLQPVAGFFVNASMQLRHVFKRRSCRWDAWPAAIGLQRDAGRLHLDALHALDLSLN